MNTSLRDQLLAAGLVTAKQVKEAERQQQRPPSRHQPQRASDQKLAAERARLEKEAKDKELNRLKEEKAAAKAAAKARRQALRQLVEQVRLPPVEIDNGDYFNFVDGSTLRRILVTPESRQQIVEGKVVIVRYDNRYALLPESAVPRVREIDERALVQHTASSATAPAPAEDDPYKDFVVPDDLRW
jgi:uncharacterized protein YaiL (DUF2058 family)